jgi:hypothetical protein
METHTADYGTGAFADSNRLILGDRMKRYFSVMALAVTAWAFVAMLFLIAG